MRTALHILTALVIVLLAASCSSMNAYRITNDTPNRIVVTNDGPLPTEPVMTNVLWPGDTHTGSSGQCREHFRAETMSGELLAEEPELCDYDAWHVRGIDDATLENFGPDYGPAVLAVIAFLVIVGLVMGWGSSVAKREPHY